MNAATDDLGRLAAEVAIRSLQSRYGDAVTRRAWDEVAGMFAPGCPVSLDLRDGVARHLEGGRAVADFIASAIERFTFFAFTIVNSAVTVGDSESGAARLYIQELRHDAGRHWTVAYGLYEDRYAIVDGTWRFTRRDYSSLARTADEGGMRSFPIPS